MDTIKTAANLMREAQAAYDKASKQRNEARKLLLESVGHQAYSGYGISITSVPGRNVIDWKLVAKNYNITPEMIEPYTALKDASLRVTIEREIIV